MRAARLLLLAAAAGAAAVALSAAGDRREPTDAEVLARVEAQARAALAGGGLDRRLAAAVEADDPAAAADLLALADLAGVAPGADLAARAAALSAPLAVLRREALDVVSCDPGPATGAARLAADLSGVGDVRDIACEVGNAAAGEEVDELTLGLAAAGAALTVAAVASAGTAAPAKAGAALLNTAHRADALV